MTAGSKNPQLIQIQTELTTLNKNLLSSLANLKKSLEIQLNQLELEAQKTNRKIATIPLIERGMIDIERQKEIYSELYSYLLKKKEETAISLAVTGKKNERSRSHSHKAVSDHCLRPMN